MTELLADRYELGDVVGSGGMGFVYRATDTKLDRPVAIKVLRGGPLADPLARSRMDREAHLAASVHHPGVAQVFDYEADSNAKDAAAFIVMQFVEGRSLAQLLREDGPMSPEQVLSIVLQVAEGLQAVHDGGIVHRDLKPANIMVTSSGRTVLVDFGIAHAATSEPLTETGALIGTADYLSPEQAAGRTATSQSDLYALGVIAYHCLTGESPFRRDTHIGTALAHLQDELPPLDADVPAVLAELIASLTAKNPSLRPTSAAAVALQAATLGGASAIDVRPAPRPLASSGPPTPTFVGGSAPSTVALHRKSPRRVFAGLAAVAVVIAAMTLPKLHGGDEKIVPQVVGLSLQDATTRIHAAGMSVSPRVVDVAGRSKGEVVAEFPKSGTKAPADGTVKVSVASGKVAVAANDVLGHSYSYASSRLEKLGFVVLRRDTTRSTGIGHVVGLDKSGRLAEGSTVTLSVAVAPIPAATPSSAATRTTSSPSGGTSPTSKSKAKPAPKPKPKKKGHPKH
jgi:beta-lactam-binding protein with PASTA domain/aminoglycoside phosphotransferase (APT) family kinase protein